MLLFVRFDPYGVIYYFFFSPVKLRVPGIHPCTILQTYAVAVLNLGRCLGMVQLGLLLHVGLLLRALSKYPLMDMDEQNWCFYCS